MKGKALGMAVSFIIAATLSASHALAQETGLTAMGLKVGLNLANNYGDDAENPGYDMRFRTGLAGGLFAEYSFSKLIAIQPEILYAMKGVVYKDEFTLLGIYSIEEKETYQMDYLEVPILLKLKFYSETGINPNVLIGPVAGILITAKWIETISSDSVEGPELTENIKDQFKNVDFGLMAGLSFDMPAGATKVSLDVRYNLGLTSIDDTDLDLDIKNSAISAMLGIAF